MGKKCTMMPLFSLNFGFVLPVISHKNILFLLTCMGLLFIFNAYILTCIYIFFNFSSKTILLGVTHVNKSLWNPQWFGDFWDQKVRELLFRVLLGLEVPPGLPCLGGSAGCCSSWATTRPGSWSAGQRFQPALTYLLLLHSVSCCHCLDHFDHPRHQPN